MPAEPVEPAVVAAPPVMWRVERTSPALRFARMAAQDAALEAGNRFDVVGVGVLYAATHPAGAFAETLAGFRPSSTLLAKMAQHESDTAHAAPGEVTRSWRLGRRLRSLRLEDPLPFLDVDDPATHTFLTQKMAEQLSALGVGNLDVATVRGPSRLLTRAIAAWAFAQEDDDEPLYGGIRYGSRLGTHECWAVFEGAEIDLVEEFTIDRTLVDLTQIESSFGLTIK
jgi:hypothetical protein